MLRPPLFKINRKKEIQMYMNENVLIKYFSGDTNVDRETGLVSPEPVIM
jgi:hypothetical protein